MSDLPTEHPNPSASSASSSGTDDYASRSESRLQPKKLHCCKGRVADITGSGMRMLVSPSDLPNVGDVQSYTFSDEKSELMISGTVKWVRKGTAFTRRSEVGVEFDKLDPEKRDAIIKLAIHGKMGQIRDAEIEVAYPDLYKLLGVTPYAKQEEIEAAYRKEAKIWHPDHNDSPDASQCFDRVRKAYSVLSDPETREKYNERFFSKNQHAA